MAQNGDSGSGAKPEAFHGDNGYNLKMHPDLNLAVLCDSNSCIPFSTKNSGESNSGAFVKDNLSILDNNRDGNLGKDELSDWASKFPDGSPPDKMTNLVIESFDDVAKLAGGDGKGISKKDLDVLSKLHDADPKKLSKEEATLLKKLDVNAQKKESQKPEEAPGSKSFSKFSDFGIGF